MKGQRVPPDDVKAICEMLLAGYTLEAVGNRFGRGKPTILRIGRRFGIEYVREPRVIPKGGKRTRRVVAKDAPVIEPKRGTGVIAGPTTDLARHFRGHAHSLSWWAEW